VEANAASGETSAQASATARRRPQDWLSIGLAALIVALGLWLRLSGLGWSLPDRRHPLATYHPDELINLNAALSADIPHGKFDIGFYNYGAFYFYLVSLAQTVGRGYGLIPATPPWPADRPPLSPVEEMARAAPEQAGLFLAGRLVTALLGTATIAVVFAFGNRLFGKQTGLLAAFLYAIAPLAVLHAHFLTVDVPATFFVALALLWAARLLKSPAWKDCALAGVWAGLAAATKYNAGLVLVAPVAALFLNRTPGDRAPRRAAPLAVLIAIAAVTFLIACPGPWLNWDAFWNGTYPGSGVRYELFEHARTGHGYLFVSTGPGWLYPLRVSLPYSLGLPLLLLALGGFVLACLRRTPQDRVLLSFLLLYYLLTSLSAVRFARYMLPLFPVLCVLAARLAMQPSERRPIVAAWRAVGAVVACLTLGWTLILLQPLTGRDPRDKIADDLEKTAPNGASVAFATTPWYYSPPLSPLFGAAAPAVRARAAQETTRYQLRIPAQEWDTGVLNPPPDYVILSTLETANPVARLRLPQPIRFMEQLDSGLYTRRSRVPDMVSAFVSFTGEGIPEDLLYTMPVLTLYAKRR
jgi:4-amino-4-deoxy-L-arabinose transferase-like glycosyltransferase